MSAIKERWQYDDNERIFTAGYLNSQNVLHWHDDCELISVARGSVTVVVGGERYLLGVGSAMFIESGAMHRISADTPDTLLETIIFDNEVIKPFALGITLRSPVLERDYGVHETYSTLMKELREQKPLYVSYAENVLSRLMIEIFRYERTEPEKPKPKSDARLKRLLSEIRLRYADYTLDDAANFMSMNKSYLSRFFTQKTGMHFMQYLNRVRVEKATELLLAGDKSVTEVADACGFDTIRNFNRIFKLLTGYAPTSLPQDFVPLSFAAEQTDITSAPTLGGCTVTESSADKISKR